MVAGMTTDGRRFVFHSLALLAFLGVVLTTGWVVFWAGFTLETSGPGPAMVRHEALAAAIGCGLLVAAAAPLRVAHAEGWLVVLNAGLAVLLAALALWLVATPALGQDVNDDTSWRWVVWMFAVTPTTWPVVLLVLSTPLLRGRSRRVPRSTTAR
jgi:hypothetical protein